MIEEICKNPSYVTTGAIVTTSLVEYWLGKTNKTTSGSILETIINLISKKPIMAVQQTKQKGVIMSAYDIKKLGEAVAAEAKIKGLSLAEETLEVLGASCYIGFKKYLKQAAIESETKIDDIVSGFYDQADVFVLPLIEKIDLNQDGK